MRKWNRRLVTGIASAVLLFGMGSSLGFAKDDGNSAKTQSIPQGTGQAVLNHAKYFGDEDSDKKITVDIVMKVRHKKQLKRYINQTVSPGSHKYHHYIHNAHQFAAHYAPSPSEIHAVTHYLRRYGIKSKVYKDNLVITTHGTVKQFNKAFKVDIKRAKLKGRSFHATRKKPRTPHHIAKDVLAILGLSDYSRFATHLKKRTVDVGKDSPEGPRSLSPSDLAKHYNVNPLYKRGAKGQGQTIGIVTLAKFKPKDAYTFWKNKGIDTKPHRIKVTDVDGGTGWDGYGETTLDVEQSGALAPKANINVYEGPNTDPGFVDAFAKAINENKAQQLSVSWGLSETAIFKSVRKKQESPQYAQVFNELYMQAAAQGISMFASAGDSGAYDGVIDEQPTYQLAVDNPADSPYITAAGGTTLPWQTETKTGNKINVKKERAWGWDYLYPYFDALGLNNPEGWIENYFVGGGGGYSDVFKTPGYQKGVRGVNAYKAIKYWKPYDHAKKVKRLKHPRIVRGRNHGRNLPDVSMNADPYTGYDVYMHLPDDDGHPTGETGVQTIGGTSAVSPQLNGLTALMNSADHTRIGFWNPQVYRFAQQADSPFKPLNKTGKKNDIIFYSGKRGTVYNPATGLGVPDVAALAHHFAGSHAHHGPNPPGWGGPGHGHPGHGPGHGHPGHGPGHGHPGGPGHGHGSHH